MKSHAYIPMACVIAFALAGCAVEPVARVEPKPVLAIPVGVEAKPVQFERILTKLPLGKSIGQLQYGWGCFPGRSLDWRGGRLNLTDEELADTFRREFENHNYPVVGDPYALFGDPAVSKVDIVVAGLIDKVDIKLCFPFSGSPHVNIGNTSTAKGGVSMRIAWQVYSRSKAKVIYETTSEGSFTTDETISGGLPVFLRNAFGATVRNLLADPGFTGHLQQDSGSGDAKTPRLTL